MRPNNDRALVLFSGGQDSATCLAWALETFREVETIGFDYGQRHAVELECRDRLREGLKNIRPAWAQRLGADHILPIPTLNAIGETAMTADVEITMGENGLPTTFVPGRNIVFVTFAAALAYRRDIRHLVTGVCETDYSGYPDCRDDTMKALQVTLNLGLETRMVVHTPLMWIDKAATWQLAGDLGGHDLIELVRIESHTCYLGDREHLNEWGYGCGSCPACDPRAEGWRAFSSQKSPN
jgi:7-cyano-7-deazaguanine synthase